MEIRDILLFILSVIVLIFISAILFYNWLVALFNNDDNEETEWVGKEKK